MEHAKNHQHMPKTINTNLLCSSEWIDGFSQNFEFTLWSDDSSNEEEKHIDKK